MSRITRVLAALAILGMVAVWVNSSAAKQADYVPELSGVDRLLTNEYAHWNPDDPRARTTRDWDVTSGSLFVRGGAGWTGVPDAVSPDATSGNGTGSSVFRVTTRRDDFENVAVSLRIRNAGLVGNGRFGPADTDGIHLFLRWKSPQDLYVVSLNRRDNRLAIKKKTPGGPVNGGSYVTLGEITHRVALGEWVQYTVQITTNDDGSVFITALRGDQPLLAVVDDGRHGAPIHGPGAVGLRGDNCEFEFADLRVRAVG